MAKKFIADDKDRERLKAQRDTIIRQEREIKLLKQQIRTLEKALNRPAKEAGSSETNVPVIEKPKKLTPAEEREATRKRFAEWRAKNLNNGDT